jgi:hypothetical protein
MYDVYYLAKTNSAYAHYDYFNVQGYPVLEVSLGDKNIVDGKSVLDINVNIANCAYAKYGVYNTNDYSSADQALAALRADANANRITESTTLKFNEIGSYIFAVIVYDESNNELLHANVSFKINEIVDLSAWTYIGTSKVIDGWVTGSLTSLDETQFEQQVDTYALNDNRNIIGLYDLYNGAFYVNRVFGRRGDSTMLTIDATDTDFIIITPQNIGCDSYDIYVGNYEGYFSNVGANKDEILAVMNDDELTYIDDSNTITIPKSFGIFNGREFTGNTVYITLPDSFKLNSVSDVSIDSNATVEYYNLNGIRVNENNLVPGLYIRRQGSTAKKVIVK